MSEVQELLKDIDKLRKNLCKVIEENNGDLQNPDVISASQILNSSLTEYNKFLVNKFHLSNK